MKNLLLFHHSKKVRWKRVSFLLHHAHSRLYLGIQQYHRVGVTFQIRPYGRLIIYEHSFDDQYQKLLHLLVTQKYGE